MHLYMHMQMHNYSEPTHETTAYGCFGDNELLRELHKGISLTFSVRSARPRCQLWGVRGVQLLSCGDEWQKHEGALPL